jgi:hypothetical protein
MKQQVKSIIETFIANAQESYPSIYSKDDVVTLLNDMLVKVDELEDVEEREDGEKTYTEEQISNAIADMNTDTIVDIDHSSAEFELDGNEVSLSNVEYEVDTNKIEINLFRVLNRK